MEDSDGDDEASMNLLRTQLEAVQRIREELAARNDEILRLRVLGVEAEAFRMQIVNLEAQLRVTQEKARMLEKAGQDGGTRETNLKLQVEDLQRKTQDQHKREMALKKLLEQQVHDEKLMRQEVEQLRTALLEMGQRESELDADIHVLTEELTHMRRESASLTEVVKGTKAELLDREGQLETLRPAYEFLEVQTRTLTERVTELEQSARRLPVLESKVAEAQDLQHKVKDLQLLLLNSQETRVREQRHTAHLSEEVAEYKALLAQQSRVIEEKFEQAARLQEKEQEMLELQHALRHAVEGKERADTLAGRLTRRQSQCQLLLDTSAAQLGQALLFQPTLDVQALPIPPTHLSEHGEEEGSGHEADNVLHDRVKGLLQQLTDLSRRESDLRQGLVEEGELRRQLELEGRQMKMRAESAEMAEERTAQRLAQEEASSCVLRSQVESLAGHLSTMAASLRDGSEELRDRDAGMTDLLRKIQSALFSPERSIGVLESADDRLSLVSLMPSLSEEGDYPAALSAIWEAFVAILSRETRGRQGFLAVVEEKQQQVRELQSLQAREETACEFREQLRQVMQASLANQDSEREEMLNGLSTQMRNLSIALQSALDQRDRHVVTVDRLQHSLTCLQQWTARASTCLMVFARAYLHLVDRCDALHAQRRYLLRQQQQASGLTQTLRKLACAVSEHTQHIFTCAYSFRSVVIAILFLNRLSRSCPHQPDEIYIAVTMPTLDDGFSINGTGSDLPSEADLHGFQKWEAAQLILRRLVPHWRVESPSLVHRLETNAGILPCLVRGREAFLTRLRMRPDLRKSNAVSSLNAPLRRHRWDAAGSLALKELHSGLIRLSASARRLMLELQEQQQRNALLVLEQTENQDKLKAAETELLALKRRLEQGALEKERYESETVSALQDKYELVEKSRAQAEAMLCAARKQSTSDVRTKGRMQEQMTQWRSMVHRYQKELLEVQDRQHVLNACAPRLPTQVPGSRTYDSPARASCPRQRQQDDVLSPFTLRRWPTPSGSPSHRPLTWSHRTHKTIKRPFAVRSAKSISCSRINSDKQQLSTFSLSALSSDEGSSR